MDELDFRPHGAYVGDMTDPTSRSREEMLDDLDASDAEIEAGDLVPGEVVLAEIQAAIDRLEAKLAAAPRRRANPRR